jgi:hypothetical protein
MPETVVAGDCCDDKVPVAELTTLGAFVGITAGCEIVAVAIA